MDAKRTELLKLSFICCTVRSVHSMNFIRKNGAKTVSLLVQTVSFDPNPMLHKRTSSCGSSAFSFEGADQRSKMRRWQHSGRLPHIVRVADRRIRSWLRKCVKMIIKIKNTFNVSRSLIIGSVQRERTSIACKLSIFKVSKRFSIEKEASPKSLMMFLRRFSNLTKVTFLNLLSPSY